MIFSSFHWISFLLFLSLRLRSVDKSLSSPSSTESIPTWTRISIEVIYCIRSYSSFWIVRKESDWMKHGMFEENDLLGKVKFLFVDEQDIIRREKIEKRFYCFLMIISHRQKNVALEKERTMASEKKNERIFFLVSFSKERKYPHFSSKWSNQISSIHDRTIQWSVSFSSCRFSFIQVSHRVELHISFNRQKVTVMNNISEKVYVKLTMKDILVTGDRCR